MAKWVLNEDEFCQAIVARARTERPDIRVTPVGRSLLLVEPLSGHRRMVSLTDLYDIYVDAPTDRDDVISKFLQSLVYQEPVLVRSHFKQHRHKLLAQVVPPTLLDYCREEHRELASVDFVDGLAITFVIDESERYSYVHQRLLEEWGVSQTTLLSAALENLQALHKRGLKYQRFGKGLRQTIAWETFDGYDASRILLTRSLIEAAAHLPGNAVIGIPHRDYLVMFSDLDDDFVALQVERIREAFEAHSYPISANLFMLVDGAIAPYKPESRRERVVN